MSVVAPMPEQAQVEKWRIDELERAGFTEQQAILLAQCAHVDLHEAVKLVQAGCPPQLALRILL